MLIIGLLGTGASVSHIAAMLLAIGIVLFFGMGWHEYAHAVVANWWGDPTPRQNGRLTPNPIVHISWVGWLMFVVLGFGILGSVPINPYKMRDPKWGNFWTSFAGPLSNLAMAGIAGIILRFIPDGTLLGINLLFGRYEVGEFNGILPDFLLLFLTAAVFYNALLFVFNLLPFFPFDGWRMVLSLLPARGIDRKQVPQAIRQNVPPLSQFLQYPAEMWQRWAQVSMYILFGLILISFAIPQFDLLGMIISQPTFRITTLILGV